MRVLPCKAACKGEPALLTKAGAIQTAGTIHGPRMTYICARCGQPSTVSASEFHSLPMTA